jgi:hypothetical protein
MRVSPPDAPSDLPVSLPDIALRHGEALWVLRRLGFAGPVRSSTFYEYIKSLRKLGVPFAHGTVGYGRKGRANYSYAHLMELALILTLRVYHVVPDSVLNEIVRHRARLYRCYLRAYADRDRRLGAPLLVNAQARRLSMRGVFLDLQIIFSGGTLARFGPPKLLSPFEALVVFAKHDNAARALLPINLSRLAERVVAAALAAPVMRPGPRRQMIARNAPAVPRK